jgi:hypothetical protein
MNLLATTSDQQLVQVEAIGLLLTVMQFGFNVVVGIVAFQFKRAHNEIRALRDAVTTADGRTHTLTEKLIDERMRAFTHQVNDLTQAYGAGVKTMEMAVADANSAIKSLGERDHQEELKRLKAIHELQVEILREAATKGDLKEHEESMRRELNDIRRKANI